MRHVCLILLSLLCLCPLPAAAKMNSIGASGKWTAYRYAENGQDVCYMVQRPAKSGMKRAKGDKAPRAGSAFMVTLRPSETVGPIVSFEAGYAFKASSEAALVIDGAHYTLFTEKTGAWARTAGIDRAITGDLRKGKTLVVQGESAKGSRSADQFDLKGTEAAYKIIAKACGVNGK